MIWTEGEEMLILSFFLKLKQCRAMVSKSYFITDKRGRKDNNVSLLEKVISVGVFILSDIFIMV